MTAQTLASSSIRQQAQAILSETFRSRAALAFVALWVIGAVVLLAYGHTPWGGLASLTGIAVFMLITALNTQPNPPTFVDDPRERRRLYLQLAVLFLLIVLTGIRGMQFHDLIPFNTVIPGWTPLVDTLERFSGRTFGNDNYLTNPVLYFVIPVIFLLLLGAKLPDLGLGRGHRVLRVTFIWAIVPVLAIAYLIVNGALLSWVGQVILSNALNNGFFEEFLFRGALQTRLRRLMSPGWALVLQAVIFGVWHVGLGYSSFGEPGGVLTALASTLAFQMGLGLAFGYIFERSRNLIAPSVFHVLYNSMFSI